MFAVSVLASDPLDPGVLLLDLLPELSPPLRHRSERSLLARCERGASAVPSLLGTASPQRRLSHPLLEL
ncbi:unnamed protein product [Lampetra fluviatilis]